MNVIDELEKLKRKHYICEDCFYSCPKSDEGCCDEREEDICKCGVEKHNNKLDEIIEYLKEKL